MPRRSNEIPTEAATAAGAAAGLDIVRETFDVIGSRVAVGTSSAHARDAVRNLLRGFGPIAENADATLPHYDLTQAPDGEWRVRVADEVVSTGDNLDTLLGSLDWLLITGALERRDDIFQLHGAALCAPTRRGGIVLVGDSGAGKTTLSLGLMLSGFVPFTDDVALLEPTTLNLQPLRRAFHVNDETWSLIEGLSGPLTRERDLPSGYFMPPQWAECPVPVRWIVFLDRRSSPPPRLAPLSTAEAATALLGQSLSVRRTARVALRTAARLTELARCYRLVTGDLPESINTIKELVAAPDALA